MDNRVVSVIASKRKRKKKKPRPATLPKLPELQTGGVSTSTPADQDTNVKPNPSALSIPQLTITPPEDEVNEIYTPPEVSTILSQGSTKKKKKKKKPRILPVVKDEVRPSVVLGYTPRSLCKSVSIQPTVSELEEVGEEAEESTFVSQNSSRSSSRSGIDRSVPELPEEEDEETLEPELPNCCESAYGSSESEHLNEINHDISALQTQENHIAELASSSSLDNTSCFSETVKSASSSEFNCFLELLPEGRSIEPPISVITFGQTANEDLSCGPQSNCSTSDISSQPSLVASSKSLNSHELNFQKGSDFCSQLNSVEPELLLEERLTSLSIDENSEAPETVLLNSALPSEFTYNECIINLPITQVNAKSTPSDTHSELKCKELVSQSVEIMPDNKLDVEKKTKAQLKAEKKLAFDAQQKTQGSGPSPQSDVALRNKPTEEKAVDGEQKTKAQLKAERKAAFEAQKGAQIAAQKAQAAEKSKADLRAERRAIQESQRQAKDITTKTVDPNQKKPDGIQKKPDVPEGTKKEPLLVKKLEDPPMKKPTASADTQDKESAQQKKGLFSNLPHFCWDPNITSKLGLSGKVVHPAIIKAGLKMAQGLISGSDERCVATMFAFREVINDYTTPPQKELSRDLDSKVEKYTEFLNKCRPISVSMTNAIKQLRWHITHIPSTMDDTQAKQQLCDDIDTFIQEEVVLSKKAIAKYAAEKIHDNDIILIYGSSPLVKQVLSEAQDTGKVFKVIVVDSRPSLDGREMVRYLSGQKISCSYVLINAVSYVMKEVNLVLLDCHSLQANGYVMSRVGTSQIALVAQASNVPVLVCCETYKFCDRVHTDAFVDNELGNPEDLVTSMPAHKCELENWKDIPHLNLVNITYDVTPADLVTAIVTEFCTLPCTAVPVVLRVKHKMSDVQK